MKIEYILKGDTCCDVKFDIADDGIYYIPLNGYGDEKDCDQFLTWEELKEVFIDERERGKYAVGRDKHYSK